MKMVLNMNLFMLILTKVKKFFDIMMETSKKKTMVESMIKAHKKGRI